jgi:hypothetical protein
MNDCFNVEKIVVRLKKRRDTAYVPALLEKGRVYKHGSPGLEYTPTIVFELISCRTGTGTQATPCIV